MIVNMPVNGAGNGPTTNNNNNGSSSNISNNNNTLMSQGQCDYNYLKRKYENEANTVNTINAMPLSDFTTTDVNPWKKRHLEVENNSYAPSLLDYEADAMTSTPTATATSTSTLTQEQPREMSFQLDLENAANEPPQRVSAANSSSVSSTAAFINDLFAYETSLLVATPTAYCGGSAVAAAHSLPTFTQPISNANANVVTSFDTSDTNWQATSDLLELDHRYNSGLQTEEIIGQLNATLQSESESQHPNPPTSNFLVPQKQQQQKVAKKLANSDNENEAETEADFEDKNLSWLLNFKFDEFPHLSPDPRLRQGQANSERERESERVSTSPSTAANAYKSNSASPGSSSNHSFNSLNSNQSQTLQPRSPTTTTTTTTTTTKTGRKFEELVMEVTSELDGNDMTIAEHVIVEDTTNKAPKKPPFTYTELIEYALEDKGELTVSGIYQWISDRFPYYKSNDDRWKNSVRHNLSINPHFRKGVKAPQGAGHLWAISSGDSAENVLAWEHKKQRLDLFFKMESINRERIQQHQQHMQQQQQLQQQQQQQQQQLQQQPQQQICQHHHNLQQHSHSHSSPRQSQIAISDHCLYDEAAVAAASITQEMLQQSEARGGGGDVAAPLPPHSQRLLPFNDLLSDEELRKTAGQILNGIHREVEVQSVNSIISTYHDVLLDNEDYLNPIHKDIVVTESGLRQPHSSGGGGGGVLGTGLAHSQYYITEIDPMELGIQMSQQVAPSEEEVLFSDEFNLNYFGYNAGSDIVA